MPLKLALDAAAISELAAYGRTRLDWEICSALLLLVLLLPPATPDRRNMFNK